MNQSIAGKTQDLQNFTVEILRHRDRVSVGTGFIVSSNGMIITCAHVLHSANINPKTGGYLQKPNIIARLGSIFQGGSPTSNLACVCIKLNSDTGSTHIYNAVLAACFIYDL